MATRRGTNEALRADLFYAMSLIGTGDTAKQIADRLVERLRESGLIDVESDKCPECNGKGRISVITQRDPEGDWTSMLDCSGCKGTGKKRVQR